MLKKILRNRLKPRHGKKMLKWLGEKTPDGYDSDHILESTFGLKLNDYLIDSKRHDLHLKKHYPKPGEEETEDEFLESFLRALENLFDYVQWLENIKNK